MRDIGPTEDAAMRRFAAAALPTLAIPGSRASRRAGVIGQSSNYRLTKSGAPSISRSTSMPSPGPVGAAPTPSADRGS
jgi:hypothetical protein